MARTDTLGNFLTDVADAIKIKKGDDTPILASEFDTEITNLPSGGSSQDWTQLGYTEEPPSIKAGLDYAKEIKQNWDATKTSTFGKYTNNKDLFYFPNVDMSNVTNAQNMFQSCVKLEYFDEINPNSNCNMKYMFNLGNTENTKLFGNRIYIANNKYNEFVFSSIGTLELNEVIITASSNRGQNIFDSITNLKIKKITDNYTKRDKQLLNLCGMDDDTIRVFLNYFKTLTTQDSDKKTLKFLGFTSANCNKAVLLDEWQDLVGAGWTTGY